MKKEKRSPEEVKGSLRPQTLKSCTSLSRFGWKPRCTKVCEEDCKYGDLLENVFMRTSNLVVFQVNRRAADFDLHAICPKSKRKDLRHCALLVL